MKIAYITTMNDSIENRRIRDEVVKMGHIYNHVYLGNLALSIIDGNITGDEILCSDSELLILRGIMSSMKTISALSKHLRENGIKVFDNNFIKHEYAISKITDMVKLTLSKITIPNSYHFRSFKDFPKAAKKLGYPLIIKSNRMGKGHGVYKADSKSDLMKLINDLIVREKEAKNYVIQEFIPYEYDIRVLVIGKKVFAMRRIPGKNEFRANYSLGGTVENYNLDNEGIKLALKAAKAVDLSVAGVDILITKANKRYILEVNHNPGFAGMEKATGENIAKVYIQHAIANAK